jgi:hypothetical protein
LLAGQELSAPSLRSHGLEFSGVLDAYVEGNTNRPPSETSQFHAFDNHNDQLRLNMVEVGISRDPSPLGCEFDFGGGDAYNEISPQSPNDPLRHVLVLTISAKPGFLHGSQVSFGKFQTSAGVESAETGSGWNYSQSLLFVYAEPNDHCGLTTSTPVSQSNVLGFQWVNGWNHCLMGMEGVHSPLPGTTRPQKSIGPAVRKEKLKCFNSWYT